MYCVSVLVTVINNILSLGEWAVANFRGKNKDSIAHKGFASQPKNSCAEMQKKKTKLLVCMMCFS